MKKTALLGASLIATKGKAMPSADLPAPSIALKKTEMALPEKRIAITLKLLESPYQRMKMYGVSNRQSNQDILEEALNEYLDKRNA